MQVYSASYFQGVISSVEGQALGVGHLHPGPEGRTLRSRAEMPPHWGLPLCNKQCGWACTQRPSCLYIGKL
jgi:hypothetical protein